VKRIIALVTAAASLTACSQTVSGTGQIGFPTDVHAVGALLQGNRTVRSAQVQLTETAGGTTVQTTGVEKLTDVKVDAMDMTETVSGTTVRFIILGTSVYAKLPANSPLPHTKPWIELTASTSDPQFQQLYAQFESSRTAGTAFTAHVFDAAAQDLKFVGTTQIDGALVGHYSLALDVASIPSDFPNSDALKQSGLKQIPLQVWIDTAGRTRKFDENITVGGQHVDVAYTLNKIDQPVHITAPPAAQVERK
jgi:predicted small secreted protein